ncbi:MAG: hypothetical protein ACE5IY_18780 [bacterium]
MLDNQTSRKWVDSPGWFKAFLAATAACLLAYGVNVIWAELRPGNVWGLTYGTLATILMVGAAFYAIRRRSVRFFSRMKMGQSHAWVQFHIYGGALFMLLVFMHTGFNLPSGPLNWWLWALSLWVTVSGLFGIVLQKWIPRLLNSALAVEVLYERIPELIKEIQANAATLIASCAEPVQDLYHNSIARYMLEPNVRLIYFVDITGGIQSRVRQFDFVKRIVSTEDKDRLQQLESMYKTKLQLDAHYTLQKALRWWLVTHVPVSILLLVLVAIHLYAVCVY